MGTKRTFEGKSREGNFQEALDAALSELSGEINQLTGSYDGSATWVISEISGDKGSIAGFRTVRVKINADIKEVPLPK